MTRSHCFDRQGNPISLSELGRLSVDVEYKVVKKTVGNGKVVSTVWLGIDHSFTGGPPLIFESMVFKVDRHGVVVDWSSLASDRYSTEDQALKGHEEMCKGHIFVLDLLVKKLEEADASVVDPDEVGIREVVDGR